MGPRDDRWDDEEDWEEDDWDEDFDDEDSW